jgi:iron complex transport system substrate-binding protein
MADPDMIILGPCGYSLERTIKDVPLLSGHPIWQELKAVRERTVYAIDGNQYLNRSGPRLVESAEMVAQMIWKGQLDLSVDADGWAPIANMSA